MWKFILLVFIFAGRAFAQESSNYQIEADYLLWFIKDNPIPVPLVTFASLDDALPGAIGQPHTRILQGNRDIKMPWMQGFEVNGQWHINPNLGLEASYFLLPTVEKKKISKTSGELGSPNLAVPVFDITGVWGLGGVPGETIFILPGPVPPDPGYSGLFKTLFSSQFQGAEINGVCSLKTETRYNLEWVWGLRWFQLEEKLRFKVSTATVHDSPFSFDNTGTTDRFHTFNNFIAGQVGLKGQFCRSLWCLEGALKGSMGSTIEKLKIQGASKTISGSLWFLTSGTGNETLPGGIFAEPSNIGSHHNAVFAYAVETELNNKFTINENWAIDIGYTFLWISKVLRPGNQIDRKINSTRTALADASRATTGIGPGPIPFDEAKSAPAPEGPAAPKVHFKQSSFWAQGLNAGITLSF